jgi:hypothetical protein
MSRQKKTRTKSTERNLPRHSRRLQQVRARIAAEAARIMATEGQFNYHAAKKKAAQRCGVSDRLTLPSNTEVEESLRTYQSLYGGTAHQENLDRLRRITLRAMRILDPFSPRLVGPVLEGTAGPHSRIALQAFADSPDALILHFLEHGESFRQEQRQIRWHDGEPRFIQLVVFDLEEAEVEVALFELKDLRQAPPSPVDGKPQRRATREDLEALLADSPLLQLQNS